MVRSRTLLLGTVCTLWAAAPLTAQVDFEYTVFGAGAVFATDVVEPFTTTDGLETNGESFTNSIGLGAAVTARFRDFGVEGTLTFVPTSVVFRLAAADVGLPQTAELAIVDDQNLLIFGLNGLYYLPGSNPFVRFYVAAGLAGKRYGNADPLGGWNAGMSDFGGSLGGGLNFAISPAMSIRLDARDYVTSFDAYDALDATTRESLAHEGWPVGSRTQHDILITFGLTLRPRS